MTTDIQAMREFGRAALERHYGELTSMSGQGVPRGTRFRYVENGKTVTCVIKISAHPAGKISFPYTDGTWGVLSEVDRVLYVRRSPEQPGQFEAQLHRQKVLLDAFNQNRKVAEAGGFTNMQAWLSAEPAKAKRNIGSGFGRFAIWTEVSGSLAPKVLRIIDIGPSFFSTAIEKAKNDLATELGINAGRIEITIRT
jgi:hypothetical protein